MLLLYLLLLQLFQDSNLIRSQLLYLSLVLPSLDSFSGHIEALTKVQGKVSTNVDDGNTHVSEADFVSCRSIWNEIGQTHLQGKENQDSTFVESLDSEGKG